ncbi:hypothetical protein PPYR_05222 [Photinus pyralis]|uniref:Choline transporter-like protein n=1 Tax=Photinus pyralis TaxID=7054 RepID=A0A1Y1JUX5_PHOPY|nr:CTL-like protein 2 isoform X2 [Photinus pyralis]KAB0800868.1 hypothetical protein PPYR_05222 [Photinus pyralis]
MAVKKHNPSDYGEPIHYDPDFNGPLKRRSCTDVLCLFLLLVFIGCWVGIGLYAFMQGNPDILLVPVDSQGARCGLDSHVRDKPYLFFFDLTKCLQPIPFAGCNTPQVCVKQCPQTLFLLDTTNYYRPEDMICTNDVQVPRTKDEAFRLVSDGKCARWYLHSESVEKRCLPNIFSQSDLAQLTRIDSNITVEMLEKVKSAINSVVDVEQVGKHVVEDIMRSWWQILLGLVFAMLVCIIYIVLMRWIASVMVWFSIAGVLAALSFGIYICYKKYEYYKAQKIYTSSEPWYQSLLYKPGTWLAFLITASVILVIILLVLIFLRKRIVIAIALIKEASKAVSSVTASLFFPIIPWVLQVGVIMYAVSVGLFLSTVGSPQFIVENFDPNNCKCSGPAQAYTNNATCDPGIFATHCKDYYGRPCGPASCHYVGTDSSAIITYLHVINVFGFFWTIFFVSGLADMVLAATFATWYWTFRKRDVPFFTVTESIIRTLRYHLGTLAFGSLIIAICSMIRALLEYIDQKLKAYDNFVTKAILCCCKCFFWCLESFIKFINRNAYIMCAIHGKNFCISAKDAFNLLMRNILRVFVLDKVTDFLLFLSKVLVTAGVTSVAYVILATDYVKIVDTSQLHYNYVPVIIIGVGTFFITLVFFSVFTMAVDTLFLCFLEDSERNDGSPEKPYFMSKNLMLILGKKNK